MNRELQRTKVAMDTTNDETTIVARGSSPQNSTRPNDYPLVRIRKRQWNILLSVLTVVFNVSTNVSLPLYSNSMTKEGHSDYPVLLLSSIWAPFIFFGIVFLTKLFKQSISLRSSVSHRLMALVGLLNATGRLLIVFASNTSRTSATIQTILSTSMIPFTVICRYAMLHKGVSRARLTCTGIVLIGLFISLEPVIFDIDGGNGGGGERPEMSGFAKVVWPLLYMFGYLPLSIKNVILERELHKQETMSLVFFAWTQLYNTVFIAMLFWTDFIPHFGGADSFQEFADNLSYGLGCQYGRDPTCQSAVLISWVHIASYYSFLLFSFFLVKYADGAVYLVVVQALVTPMGALFWTFFRPVPQLHWDPHFLQLSTLFLMVGIVIMVPAVAMYNYFGTKEEMRERQRLEIQE